MTNSLIKCLWVTYYDENHNLTYCETSDKERETYYLYTYDVDKSEWNKLPYKADNPIDLRKHMKSSNTVSTDKPKRGRPAKGKLF